jgi:hypothetical protein
METHSAVTQCRWGGPSLSLCILGAILLSQCGNVLGFQAPKLIGSSVHLSRHFKSSLSATRSAKGMGGGMAGGMAASPKKGKGVGKPSESATKAPFNVNSSLLRLEKRYEEISKAAAKTLAQDNDSPDDLVTTEYVVAARVVGKSQRSSVPDWVPIAQLCLARPASDAHTSEGAFDPVTQAAVSLYCRELTLAASIAARLFNSVVRSEMQYSVESLDSFHKHVYEVVIEGKNEDAKNEGVMTKLEARTVLQLEGDAIDKSEIKRAYRNLSFALHPDRFVGTDKTNEEIKVSSDEYARVKLAYETMSSGVRNEGRSWYESLGGKSRTDFAGPINLLPLSLAESTLKTNKAQSAITSLSSDIVQTFVVRSQSSV